MEITFTDENCEGWTVIDARTGMKANFGIGEASDQTHSIGICTCAKNGECRPCWTPTSFKAPQVHIDQSRKTVLVNVLPPEKREADKSAEFIPIPKIEVIKV
ncbi:MAG: hypothetical protein E6R03_11645 [Hyphomicrobiaceae bacterium]|nr:MAG: hypothetical protein E6R03_11645 [Hyphomicrobiaceae bacterium]